MSKRPIENSELYTYIGKQICEARYQYRVVGGIQKGYDTNAVRQMFVE